MSKRNEGKYKPHLIYTSLLKEVSKVREYGIKKYGGYGEDWRTPKKEWNWLRDDGTIKPLRE